MRLSAVRLRLVAGAALASFIVAAGTADGQGAGGTAVPKPVAIKPKDREALDKFKSKGEKLPNLKDAVRAVARLGAYSLAYFPVDGSPTDPVTNKPRRPQDDDATSFINTYFLPSFYNIPGNRPLRSDEADYLTEVSKAMDPELKLVFEKDTRPLVKLNAVRFMSEIARGPNPALTGTLLEIVNEKLQNEAFKNYAYQGLRNLLVQRTVENREKPLISSDDPKLLEKISKALEAAVLGLDNRWIGQPPDVVRFIRGKAVQALGAVPYAAVRIRRDEILARPATALLRVAISDPAIQPSPSVSERAEAIVGLCSMQIDPSMNLDVLAYGIDKALLDLVSAQGEQSASKVSTLPWRATGARMQVAFEGWKRNGTVGRNLKAAQKPEAIWDIADRLKEVASAFEEGGVDAKTPITALTDWIQNNRPTAEGTLLFADDPASKFVFPK